ncbi:hypothetical protein ANCCEY_02321 [Ancylostoma ceylanicum]|uniref:SKI-interacting protein SKIP SNW domain-containing protein n=1 Tax=Ancylostoma ceylanicum TaxID=53326 RepID=A0A0D6M814_9BILA|nr:hypothetical protein ANCCEY_02321 [Ancylostoma ceylanicum]
MTSSAPSLLLLLLTVLSKIASILPGGGAPIRSPKTDYPVAAPVFVKNRYGREDMLALMGDTAGHPAPEGLQNCPFYVEEALPPIVCYPLSDLEQRLQHNINSSKAMSSLSHAERASVATGGAYGGGGNTDGSSGPHKASPGAWTPVKPWTNRGRGAATSARGGGVAGTTFNSRAQGLYDPRDPKDRPRNRMRSTSDEGDVSSVGEGGWTTAGGGKHAWGGHNKDAGQHNVWNGGQELHSFLLLGGNGAPINVAEENTRKSESGTMPEWMDDGEDQEKTESSDDTTSATGSFDEHGRFRKKEANSSTAPPDALRPDSDSSRNFASIRQQNDSVGYAHSATAPQMLPTAAPVVPTPVVHQNPPQFYYLDPTKQERGPFEKYFFRSGGMWGELGAPTNMMYGQPGYDPIAAERKRIEEEQRRILEEQVKMREYQERLMREMQKQREEHEKQLMEQKLALLKHQEEIERRERELKESAEETKARLEMERLALAEKARQIEEERAAKIKVV